MSKPKISNNDIGISGEFYIAHILAKKGFKVSVTLGRTEGFDLFVQNPNGINMTISVKTTRLKISKYFMMGKKADTLIDEHLFYAFVKLNLPDDIPEFWIVPSKVVAPIIKKAHDIWLTTPAKSGVAHKETSMRLFRLENHPLFPEDWEEQLKSFKSNIKSLEELK